MYFVLLAAALAILAGVVAVAMGHGGEMAEFEPDRPVMPVRLTSAADVGALRLPVGLLGYQQQQADEALRAMTALLADREAEIARLRAELGRRGQQVPPAPAPAPAMPEPPPAPPSPPSAPSAASAPRPPS